MKAAWSLLIASTLALAHPAMGQATQPSAAGTFLAEKPLKIDAGAAKAATARANGTASQLTSGTPDLTRMFAGLVVVIAVIFLLKAGAKKLSLTPSVGKAGLVRVISRSSISPRQHVLLLHVGKRVIVVGDSGGAMSPLAEITDSDEVAALVGAGLSRDMPAQSSGASFGNIFRKASEPFDGTSSELTLSAPRPSLDNVEPVNSDLDAEMGGLLNKVRFLKQRFG